MPADSGKTQIRCAVALNLVDSAMRWLQTGSPTIADTVCAALYALSEQQIRDLFAYLRGPQPLAN